MYLHIFNELAHFFYEFVVELRAEELEGKVVQVFTNYTHDKRLRIAHELGFISHNRYREL